MILTDRWSVKLAVAAILSGAGLMYGTARAEKRNAVSFLRGPYNTAFFRRENRAFRISAAIHYAHAKQHDVLLLTPLNKSKQVDQETDESYVDFVRRLKARTEPTMEFYGPYTAQVAWKIYRAIDWTHIHHEQTYDILAERSISWPEKKRWTDRAVNYYLHKNDVAFSCAPLDVTMRRASVMMKPYFTYFRNEYPKSNNYFYFAHWWHPVVYEAQMLGGNDGEQQRMVREVNDTGFREVMEHRPLRMILSRENMPRYSRLSPESANIFDNLHMFHGIAYDILAYEGWTKEQQRRELYRVIDAMKYRKGDENLARKFSVPYPDLDPRVYYDWQKGMDGEMNRIMREMMMEMMPQMMPREASAAMREKMMAQMKVKLTPGFQEGEIPGSLHDALMKLMPDMKMMPEAMQPGATPQVMVEAMLKGWEEKYGKMPDIPPFPMESEPKAPPPLPQTDSASKR